MKKSLDQAKKDYKKLRLDDVASKEGVVIVDYDKFERNQRVLGFALFFLVVLLFLFELSYVHSTNRYHAAATRCYEYFRNLQGSQVLEICREVFR